MAIARHGRLAAAAGLLLSMVVLGAFGAQARAATDVYPPGGGTFSGGAQGWQTLEAECSGTLGLELLCDADGSGYDGSKGDPAGSLAANSNVTLNLAGLFEGSVRFQSPGFAVARNGTATLHVDRAFDPEDLVSLAPQSTYTVSLLDRSDGDKVVGEVTETLSAAEGFSGRNGIAEVTAGHDYAIAIDVDTSSSVASVGLLGTVQTSLDNVRLVVRTPGSGGGDGNGGSGDNGGSGSGNDGRNGRAGSVSNRALAFLVRRYGIPARAVLRAPGRYAVTRVRCPARARNACLFAVRGLAGRRLASTARRVVRVGRGSSRQVGLRVRPRFRHRVRRGNTMLVRVAARSGKARAVVHKRLLLLKRR